MDQESSQWQGKISKLQSEIDQLRCFNNSLQDENKKLTEERDSLQFALQIIAREATGPNANADNHRTMTSHHNTTNNSVSASSDGQSIPVTSEGNQDDFTTVGASKKKGKKKNKNKKTQPLAKENQQEQAQPTLLVEDEEKTETTLLIGDSMINNIQGKELGKSVGHRVVVKYFLSFFFRLILLFTNKLQITKQNNKQHYKMLTLHIQSYETYTSCLSHYYITLHFIHYIYINQIQNKIRLQIPTKSNYNSSHYVAKDPRVYLSLIFPISENVAIFSHFFPQ